MKAQANAILLVVAIFLASVALLFLSICAVEWSERAVQKVLSWFGFLDD